MSSKPNMMLKDLAETHGTPLYVYDSSVLKTQISRLKRLHFPYGGLVRYAMKANHHPGILAEVKKAGLGIDASSSYEAVAALDAGFEPGQVLLTSQQSPHNMAELVDKGVQFNATSLRQIELYGQAARGGKISLRFNPGIGSGLAGKINVGGGASSFGIWHEYFDEAIELADKYDLEVVRVHTHIGSGTELAVWAQAVDLTLGLAEKIPSSKTVNFGGGYKVAITPDEEDTPIEKVGKMIDSKLVDFHEKTGRQLQAEVEPGKFVAMNAGVLLARVDDVVDTGPEGYRYVKLDTGMSDFLRPALYAAEHVIEVVQDESSDGETGDFVVVGHCCESTDVLTVARGDSSKIRPIRLENVKIGSLVVVRGAGAYCASMRAVGFNGFPLAKEVLV